MSTFTPAHAAVWFEIPVTDMTKAKKFYEAVTHMEIKEDHGIPSPNPMAIFQAKDPDSGVAGHLYPGVPTRGGGHTVHLAVPQPLESALKRVGENGGKVVSEIVSIPAGRFAYCEDPDGNSVGFFTANQAD